MSADPLESQGFTDATTKDALDRFNHSFEYDGPGGDYVRFFLEELLPNVEKKTTAGGSSCPSLRAVAPT